MVVKKSIYTNFILAILVFTLVACSSSKQTTETPSQTSTGTPASKTEGKAVSFVSIGTSSAGSPFYVLSVGMGELIRNHTKMNTTVEPVGGSDANIFAIQANKVDLAMVSAYSAVKGFNGEDAFKDRVDISLVAQGQKTLRQIVVTKKSGIKKPEDLVGKTIIAKRPALPELELVANALLEVYDIPKDKVKMVTTAETKEAIEALNLGSVDAAVIPAGLGSADLMQMLQEGKVEFLNIDKDKQDAMLKKLPSSFFAATIPANTYKHQDSDVNVFAFSTYLIASGKLQEQAVYEITKAIMGNTDEFKEVHKEAKEWTIENTLNLPKVPFHPGAIKYFKEIGKWDAKMDEIQKSLSK
jgi:TRAP transporter TAXI family solute receptor